MSNERTRTVLTAIRQTAERQLKQIDGLLAMLEEDPEQEHVSTQPDGCQHLRTVETPTLGQPGGKLCLDCEQNI